MNKAQHAVDQTAKQNEVPTIRNGRDYPNKQDYEPRTGNLPSDELPLSDPADSNMTDAFEDNDPTRTNEANKDGYNETDPGEDYPFDPNRGNK